MIAKITHGSSITGALSYNHQKVVTGNGQILYLHKMLETPTGSYTLNELTRSFEPYLMANRKTEKPALHISLNPDPKDGLSDCSLCLIAQDYMEKMGYGAQPYVVFKHTDIERTHIHIVSTCVTIQGKKLSDAFEKRRSMAACRELEIKFGLYPASQDNKEQETVVFRPVDNSAGNIKAQVASVIRYLPQHYRFQGMGAYNALLSLFNIYCEQVQGESFGKPKQGIIYFALDNMGNKAGNPLKSSLFGKTAGSASLQEHFKRSADLANNNAIRKSLRETIIPLQKDLTKAAFLKRLSDQGINTVIRTNEQGRIYGITFIDHNSKTVWNGSQLGKELSANIFNALWKDSPKTQEGVVSENTFVNDPEMQAISPHPLFDFDSESLIGALTGLLPQVQGDDYEEIAFERRMHRKKKKRGKP